MLLEKTRQAQKDTQILEQVQGQREPLKEIRIKKTKQTKTKKKTNFGLIRKPNIL